ncbi:hypothetical protein BU25DRAFT_260282 [Macroventuria anomochaeta]|uniref:Uncharacterized protein n=1 Tax=Macroventuria anomochaeta TaxID=301207 RepID=A0ACB6S6W9_9PLEO|nr:uncharacterized protein BU25DRAFT_260282 [Macroventuria anomochaeta]KAF2629876.1 hypothetical protein BU25DRAFT_260282 [Macroventuria anomochaeta]
MGPVSLAFCFMPLARASPGCHNDALRGCSNDHTLRRTSSLLLVSIAVSKICLKVNVIPKMLLVPWELGQPLLSLIRTHD